MSVTAGALSQVSVGSNSAVLSSAVATGGTGPYTYQWYRSTTSGFTPGGGNIISGATALSLSDSGLVPNTPYFYKVVATDTGNSNLTNTSSQLAVTTSSQSLNQNAFAQSPTRGMIDLRFDANTVSVQIDVAETATLYPGSPVKMATTAGGVPKVLACTADTDEVLGFINFDAKSPSFVAGAMCEISMSGNVMFLYATGAIVRGAQVCLDVAGNGVKAINGSGGEDIVGWAYDKAAAAGDLIRVFIKTPSFLKDGS